MAAQFGSWNFDEAPTPLTYIERVTELLSPYGPDGHREYRVRGVDLLWFSFNVTDHEAIPQPVVLNSGEVLMWQGRLDNGSELIRILGDGLAAQSCDLEVVTAAWSCWQEDCLGKLIGDWSLSVWNPRDRRAVLAADILATRHLCYAVRDDRLEWSSVPDPLVLLSGESVSLDEEYLAGWLAAFPRPHLTPFSKIRRVPPASMVVIQPGRCTVRRYWDFDGDRRIHYRNDASYEEHFRDLFRQSVRRRLRSAFPVLAELSGGMDSSAIVCIADQVTSESVNPPIDTVSYYNDSEPNWNERPWFTRVEAHRGQTGFHIEVGADDREAQTPRAGFSCRPGAGMRPIPVVELMKSRGHRVLLSGIGGDEFLGGVPTPLPELEDLLARGKFPALGRRILLWAMAQRRPWLHLFRDIVRAFTPSCLIGFHRQGQIPWFLPDFISRQKVALEGYRRRLHWVGPLPSFQENADALDGIRRQLGCTDVWPGYPFERRYPFLDRDLLEFLFAIPREQLVRPGQRRSLMRRALRGIVPDAVLDRRRKAYVTRGPLRLAEASLGRLAASHRLASEEVGIVDSAKLMTALRAARAGQEIPLIPLIRTLAVEGWLQELAQGALLGGRPISVPFGNSIGNTSDIRVPDRQGTHEAAECRL